VAPTGGLYEFDLETRTLTLRYALPSSEVPRVLGASEDASRIYFGFSEPLTAQAEFGSMYLLEGNELSLVSKGYDAYVQVSPDGQQVALTSQKQLTSYDNDGFRGVYLYDNSTRTLSCVSCRADGLPPQAESSFGFAGVVQERRNLMANGERLVFESSERLVPEDANGTSDVYLYADGGLRLLSHGDNESLLVGASESGDDVFIATTNPLVSSDLDGATDIYDARIDGGFKEPPGPDSTCVSEGCQGTTLSAPAGEQIGSTVYSGPANRLARKHAKKHRHRGKHHKKHHSGDKHRKNKHQRGKHHRQTTRAHG
jgi:hypothetical protein